MQHKGAIIIETSRLILRQFAIDDAEAAFRNWTSDDKVTEFLQWPSHENIALTQDIIKSWVDGYAKKNYYNWAIVLKENGNEPIGSIGVVGQNERGNTLTVGYCIGAKWWNRGIMSEAFSGVISFLFDEVGANRIASDHDPMNENSGKVMLKCGLSFEGVLRQSVINNRGLVDAVMYSILREEYCRK